MKSAIRSPLLLAAPLLGVGLLAGAGAPATAAAACKAAAAPAYAVANKVARKATLCLLNSERSKHGLSKLPESKDLRKAAKQHTRTMIQKRCFSHTCPGEGDLTARVRARGYLSCNCSWTLGENIGYGFGSKSTPRSMVEAWMDSSGHRHNILSHSFEQIGIGIKPAAPRGGSSAKAATYTTAFGAHD
jgi:uncharacterized protein YkwD